MLRSVYLATALLGAVVAAGGCAAMRKGERSTSWPWQAAEPEAPPAKIVAMWTDTVLYQPNQPPRRGFGGRIMFYDSKGKDPIKVDGSLVVYAFDEESRDPDNVKPDRKYVFTKEQFTEHYSKSSIGHSYSVWVPWDEVGNEQREISLIVRLVPAKGPVVVGEQTKHILPGPTKEMIARSRNGGNAKMAVSGGPTPAPGDQSGQVRATGHEAPAAAEPAPDRISADAKKMQTATIAMPSRLGRGGANVARQPIAPHATPTSPTMAPQRPPAVQNPTGYAPAGYGAPGYAPAAYPQGALPPAAAAPSAAPGTWAPPPPWAPYRPTQATPDQSSAPLRTPQARSAPARRQALAEPIARLERDRAPWQHGREGSQIHPGPNPPAPAPATAAPASFATAATGPY